MYLQRQTTPSFLFIISLWIVSMRSGFASSTKTLRFSQQHNKDDVIVPLYPVYTHQQMFKKSFEFGYDYHDVDENGKYA